MANEQITRQNADINGFAARRLRAIQRMQTHTEPAWCFPLLGITVENDPSITLGDITIRPVQEPPGAIELAHALTDSLQSPRIGCYSYGIEYELAVTKSHRATDEIVHLAWSFVSLMRIKTLVTILVPAAIDCSWSIVAGANYQSVESTILEDVPKARQFGASNLVTKVDIAWVRQHLVAFIDLLEIPRFRMAVDALTTHHHEASLRMTAASLWAGIESLFSVESELRFRLSAYIAALLHPPGTDRLNTYKTTKKLYDIRSKAVHGGSIDEGALNQHIVAVRTLLGHILGACIEAKEAPELNRLEERLFGEPLANDSAQSSV